MCDHVIITQGIDTFMLEQHVLVSNSAQRTLFPLKDNLFILKYDIRLEETAG